MGFFNQNEASFYYKSLLAGAAAGFSVDVSLYPLDTIKTRIQSSRGFFKSGGFNGLYSGLLPAALGSTPTAALFFLGYESSKSILKNYSPSHVMCSHMVAASIGEMSACLARVPTDVIKQRAQIKQGINPFSILLKTLKTEGFFGLYRGYFSTLLREIPFSFIQFPLWELSKKKWSEYQRFSIQPWQSSICGACSGCVAAISTTPLDVAKTRIMLAEKGSKISEGNICYVLKVIYNEAGIQGLFAGAIPRMVWISIGGAIFLGIYDKCKVSLGLDL